MRQIIEAALVAGATKAAHFSPQLGMRPLNLSDHFIAVELIRAIEPGPFIARFKSGR